MLAPGMARTGGGQEQGNMMHRKLRRQYAIFVLPVVFGFAVAGCLKACRLIAPVSPAFSDPLSVLLFVLAAGLAIAYPAFFRALFAHRNRFADAVLKSELIKFERYLMGGALLTPYLALLAYALSLPDFYAIGIFLMSLYAVYFFYPSKKRIAFEQRIFRAY
jgi:hypothetical protein